MFYPYPQCLSIKAFVTESSSGRSCFVEKIHCPSGAHWRAEDHIIITRYVIVLLDFLSRVLLLPWPGLAWLVLLASEHSQRGCFILQQEIPRRLQFVLHQIHCIPNIRNNNFCFFFNYLNTDLRMWSFNSVGNSDNSLIRVYRVYIRVIYSIYTIYSCIRMYHL